MRIIILFMLAILCSAPISAQTDAEFIRSHFNKMEVMIPMRDGIRLFTSIYLPKDTTQKYPVLLKRTPYSCAPYGAGAFQEGFQNMALAHAGYIWVDQDVRGKYMSEGEYMDIRPFNPNKKTMQDVDEASDTYDTVDWLVKNLKSCNGRVGVYGISYPGFYATMAILSGHPAVRAVSPQAPVTDWFIGDDFHHNGAFMVMDAFSFYSGFGKPRPEPTTQGTGGFDNWQTPDNYKFYLETGALPNYNTKYLKNGIPFWNDLLQHPDYDAWWQARNPRPHLVNVHPAVLTVGGLFDAEDCFGAWNIYKAIEKQNNQAVQNRIVEGPWCHGCWERTEGDKLGNIDFGQKTSLYFQQEIEFRFFEYYLKDRGTMDLPDATIFETGSNQWTHYAQWPPEHAVPVTYYLQAKGGLGTAAPEQSRGFEEYISDPAKPVPYAEQVHLDRTREYMTDDQRFAARRPDVLVFDSGVLTDSLHIAGPITADLWVSTSRTDADFVVKLIDVFPDTLSKVSNNIPLGGYQMLVRAEIMRGRYRNSFSKPEPFVPGQPTRVRFDMPDVAHCFLPGHRIMVQVQSSWFPLVDRNPQQFVNIYKAGDEAFVKSTIRVYRSKTYPSGVVLHVRR